MVLLPSVSRSNVNLGMLVFGGGRKTGVPGEKSSERGREPTERDHRL